MRKRKSWFKKAMVLTVIAAVIGGGVYAASEMDNEHEKQGFDPTKQTAQQFVSEHNKDASNGENGHHEKGDRGEEGHHEEGWDEAGIAAGVGGILLGAGFLYWIIKRKKRSNAAGHVAVSIPSTTEFLDQWETNQMNSKETK
ncbi:hypothetical protein ACFFSY_22530 [Paenibacillus aurantiacus]|uniref:LPXTG cell wall anchor domain-containing protein n=1 Tax=Paenibacillus aurantiacus TaxID=1936118 RepID=A0ABV5KVV3_9BACL